MTAKHLTPLTPPPPNKHTLIAVARIPRVPPATYIPTTLDGSLDATCTVSAAAFITTFPTPQRHFLTTHSLPQFPSLTPSLPTYRHLVEPLAANTLHPHSFRGFNVPTGLSS